MSKRWKFQIGYGLAWAGFMTVFSVLFDMKEKGFVAQFQHPRTWALFGLNFLAGTFVMGYFFWKGKMKQEQNSGNV